MKRNQRQVGDQQCVSSGLPFQPPAGVCRTSVPLSCHPNVTYLRRQVWHRTPSCNHCGNFSAGQTHAVYPALTQAEAELGAGGIQIRTRTLHFWVEKKRKGFGQRWSREINTSQHGLPLPLTWFHKQKNCLFEWISGEQEDLLDEQEYPQTSLPSSLQQWLWDYWTSVWVPVMTFPNFVT